MSPRRAEPDAASPGPVDVAVIGAGAAGICAARAAAAALEPEGGRVVLIGDARPGGAARLVADGGVLLECATRGLDWHATRAHLRTVRAMVEDRSREAALRQEGVDVVLGRARLLGAGRIAVETRQTSADHLPDHLPEVVTARRIVLATGDEDRLPDLSGLADARYVTVSTLLGVPDLPPTMVVVGGGPSGCEVAQALARFGVAVTLVERADRLLPGEHADASALVTSALRDDGVRVFTGSAAVTVAPTLDGGVWLGTQTGGDLAAEGLVLATGRRAAVRGLDLPAVGVRLTADGWVGVDERLATTAPDVFATGRVTGLLPHGAEDPVMARVAGRNAVSRKPRSSWSPVGLPRVVRTEPGVGAVGLAASDAGSVPGARVSDLPLAPLDRALLGEVTQGLVTLVAGPRQVPRGRVGLTGRGEPSSPLLGASIVGPHAGELVGLAALALRSGMSIEQLAQAPLSSRTWGVALQHAAEGLAAPVEAVS